MRPFLGILAVALVVGLIVAIALTPPVQLYSSGALYQAGNAPPNVIPSPDWGAGLLAGGGVVLVLAGAWFETRRRRAR